MIKKKAFNFFFRSPEMYMNVKEIQYLGKNIDFLWLTSILAKIFHS